MKAAIGLLISALIVIGLVYLKISLPSWGCSSAWPKSFLPEWKWNVGCTIVVNDIRVPAENYRALE